MTTYCTVRYVSQPETNTREYTYVDPGFDPPLEPTDLVKVDARGQYVNAYVQQTGLTDDPGFPCKPIHRRVQLDEEGEELPPEDSDWPHGHDLDTDTDTDD